MTTLLEVTGVTARYGRNVALRNVSVRVEEGQAVAVLGPNGAGKTTLLRTISGMVPSWEGRISFDGRSLRGSSPESIARSGVAHVPEGRGVLRQLTVRENLWLGALQGRDRRRWEDRLEHVLTLFPPLRERLHVPASVLSGGQQQMLVLGRALLSEPRLLMIDELSFGLAPLVRKEMFSFLETLKAQGLTILLVEQNVGDALQLADVAYCLAVGEVRLEGSAAKLRDDPELVRGYLA
jgi:branched-chain amino acid transport system ATP-binding protein